MPETLYAKFDDTARAELAHADLLERGARREDVSLTREPSESEEVHAHEEVDYDVLSGMADGAAVGLFLGFLEGLATLFVPGAGWVVVGAGAATTLTGALVGAAAGSRRQASARHTVARAYRSSTHGLVCMAITLPSGDMDRKTAEEILQRHGASDIRS